MPLRQGWLDPEGDPEACEELKHENQPLSQAGKGQLYFNEMFKLAQGIKWFGVGFSYHNEFKFMRIPEI